MTRKYTRIVVIYGVPLLVDSSVYGAFGELLCMPTFNKHVVTNNKNKQVLIATKKASLSIANKNKLMFYHPKTRRFAAS